MSDTEELVRELVREARAHANNDEGCVGKTVAANFGCNKRSDVGDSVVLKQVDGYQDPDASGQLTPEDV